MPSYDAIIIGGGTNGLAAAGRLAKAGRKVCVLERRHILGGCACTEELWPGYKVSTAAYVISLFQTQILRDLCLKEYGLRILPRNPSSFTPLADGRSLLMGPDAALNQREISKFSVRDAAAYPRYEALLERVAATLEPVLAEAAPDPLPLPESKEGLKGRAEVENLVGIYAAMSERGVDDVLAEFGGKGFGVFKPALAELLAAKLAPIAAEMRRLNADAGALDAILRDGAARARAIAAPIMAEVRGKVGFWGG